MGAAKPIFNAVAKAVKKIAGPAVEEVSENFGKAFAGKYKSVMGNLPNLEKDFFPTADNVSSKMIDWATDGGKRPLGRVIEPHGGKGDLAASVYNKTGIMPEVLELDPARVKELNTKGIPAKAKDFLTHEDNYDTYMMNPPFSEGQARVHILHALNHLNPGGRIAAVVDSREVMLRSPLGRWIRDNDNVELISNTSMRSETSAGRRKKSVAVIGIRKPLTE